MSRFVSPTGTEIIGTRETIPGVALINGIDPETGEPDYSGTTDVDWDGQESELLEGELIWVDENGKNWSFDELVRVEG